MTLVANCGAAAVARPPGAQSSSTQDTASLEGKVCDSGGDPLSKVAVRLERASADPTTTVTDSAGHFRFSSLPAGSYHLVLSRDGFRTLALSPAAIKAGESKHLDVVLEKGPAANPASMEFSDAPNFAVAGITDWSNVGLHGSDANVRTSDSLAKETASLKSSADEKSTDASRDGEAHRVLGDSQEASGDPIAAAREYEAAVKIDPSEQNYFAWGAELLLHRAGQAAVQIFSSGVKAHPDSSRMIAGLAAAFYSNGQYNEAAAQLCRASALDPSNPAPYLFLGKMEQAAAEPFSCSEPAFARFAANQPANPQANFFYGFALWKKARQTQDSSGLAAAEQLFWKAIQLSPTYPEAYLQLGILYDGQGKRDSALAAFQKAVAFDPSSSAAHYQLSLAYRRSGDAAKAGAEMKSYDELRRSEDAALEKERRQLRQLITVLKQEQRN